MNKRGTLLVNESVRVILAVAIFAAMVFLMVSLFSPVFDEADDTAKSYFEMLDRVINDVGKKDVSFYMLDNGKGDLNFYLVYFGSVFSFEKDDKIFTRKPDDKENVLCICSERRMVVACKYCRGMEMPVKLNGEEDLWVVGEGKKMDLHKTTGVYDVSVEV